MLLVLMDNATSEYAFITAFFNDSPPVDPLETPAVRSPAQEYFNDAGSVVGSVIMRPGKPEAPSEQEQKETREALEGIWKQVFETALQYCKVSPSSRSDTPQFIRRHRRLRSLFGSPFIHLSPPSLL